MKTKIINMSIACSIQNINHLTNEQIAAQYKISVDTWQHAKTLYKHQQSSTYGNKMKDFVNFDTMTLI